MKCVLKTLLLWLMIVALPIRGLAAVSTPCSPDANHSAIVMMNPGAHWHAASDTGFRAYGEHADAVHEHDTAESAPKAGNDLQHNDADCSTCAACYIGTAAPPLEFDWSIRTVSEAVVILPAVAFTDIIPAGIERPPRHNRT